jgi:2-C-methyl-D-erythritol 4-phosphate cytidylyltransferase/2-C-methyl-D-erythritol 2,4-cyclodiphosphate synthase
MDGVDKIAHEVAGRPIVAWAVDALAAAPEVDRIVVVCGRDRVESLLAADWLAPKVVAVVEGGRRRQESVAAGVAELERLDSIDGDDDSVDGIVLVHDGARPLVTPALVSAVAAATVEHGAAIPVLPLAETLKRVDAERVAGTIDRTGLGTAQTPQGIRRGVLLDVLRRLPPDRAETFTDEAAMLEACNIPVHVVPGEPTNLKVTLPADLGVVEDAIARRTGAARLGGERVGFGRDSHPFGPGEPLALGGVVMSGAPRLHGHSDGDVALHAVADALLGAGGLGDLGRLFPADASTRAGVASGELVRDVVRRLEEAGYRPARIDLTIVGARPRLADTLPAMAAAIAELTGLPAEAVSVKASTGNLSGDEGAGRGMSASAIAVVRAASGGDAR